MADDKEIRISTVGKGKAQEYQIEIILNGERDRCVRVSAAQAPLLERAVTLIEDIAYEPEDGAFAYTPGGSVRERIQAIKAQRKARRDPK